MVQPSVVARFLGATMDEYKKNEKLTKHAIAYSSSSLQYVFAFAFESNVVRKKNKLNKGFPSNEKNVNSIILNLYICKSNCYASGFRHARDGRCLLVFHFLFYNSKNECKFNLRFGIVV